MSEYNVNLNGEILDNAVIGAEQLGDYDTGFTLLPEGDYDFTVVKIEQSRYTPGPNSKIGACKQITLTLRVTNPETGEPVDLKHNLYMWGTTLGMIAQYYDSIGIHKKGEPVRFDWRNTVHEGKTGRLKLTHREYTSKTGEKGMSNNIKRLYPKEVNQNPAPQNNGWSAGKF